MSVCLRPRLTLVIVLGLAAVWCPPTATYAQQPSDSAAVSEAHAPLVDSLQSALDRFEGARPPTATDSAALHRWADSLETVGESLETSDPSRARIHLRQARRAYRQLGDSAQVGGVTDMLGLTYRSQGQYEEALAHHREALALKRAIEDRKGASGILNNIGIVHWRQGRYEEALARYREALRIKRDIGDRKGIASALINIGIIHWNQGRYEEALDRYREALAIKREIGDRPGIASALNNIGIIHWNQGRYEEALDRYRESLRIEREIGDRGGIASSLDNIGSIYWSQGQYEEALARYREALTIRRELGDRAGIAKSLTNIGVIYRRLGRPEEALARYQKALKTYRAIGNRDGTAIALNNIGEVNRDQGRPAEALAHYRKSLTIERELGNRSGIAADLNHIGAVHQDQGRPEEALARYREALAINREIDRSRGVARSLVNIGALHLGQGRLRAATDTLGRAARRAEELRLSTTSPEARRSLLSMQIDVYHALTTTHVRAGRPDSALRAVEQARARLLSDRLAGTATGDTSIAPPSAGELRRTLGPDEAGLLYANANSQWPLTVLVVTRDTTIARELPDSTVQAAIEREYPTRLNRLRREEGPLTAALGTSRSSEQGTTPSLAEIVRLYRYYLTRDQSENAVQRDLARRLHDLLIAPVTDVLADKSDVTVVPTGALGYLPVETLRGADGTYLAETKHVRYVQSMTVLRQLQRRDYAERQRPLLAFGGAAYETDTGLQSGVLIAKAQRDSARVATEDHASTLLRDAGRRMEQGKSPRPTYQRLGYALWSDLPGTKDEARQLAQIAGKRATVITGAEASEDTLRAIDDQGQLRTYRRVHFATHGVAVPESPALSALVLSQVGASDSLAARDGYLTMDEIATLELRADVAVLSACQTGLGRIVAGEGVVSLSHAFLRAGANATLVSQWKVLDESTRQFMASVYERAQGENTSFAEAVTATKRAFIEGEHGTKNTDPLRWAPFVYYGRE